MCDICFDAEKYRMQTKRFQSTQMINVFCCIAPVSRSHWAVRFDVDVRWKLL